MFKNLFIILMIALFSGCSLNQKHLKEPEKIQINENLLSHIKYILYLIGKNDLQTLNKSYINSEFGFYEVNIEDGKILITNKQKLEEIDNYVGSFEIKNEDVNFYCSPYNDALYGWNQDGVFISLNTEKYLEDYLNEQNIQRKDFIKEVLENSIEVIITYNTIFYLTKIDDKYYITLIDGVKTDCSNLELE
ncbi:hypothetical protein [Aliarcobacter vitoriensis]|uniref:Lipoprotein n=1 Tax=Aliarcobacter vitoriensis TaxID=2011099 RepID=A0A366MSH1_9BACT|nr:hypothetical protein [Aliarcobacter vitoriensis]RBQ28554.1 hypothetical protein CRU91_08565 [Aliarcobacter vitoriensis]